jgi:hypothetical protein
MAGLRIGAVPTRQQSGSGAEAISCKHRLSSRCHHSHSVGGVRIESMTKP